MLSLEWALPLADARTPLATTTPPSITPTGHRSQDVRLRSARRPRWCRRFAAWRRGCQRGEGVSTLLAWTPHGACNGCLFCHTPWLGRWLRPDRGGYAACDSRRNRSFGVDDVRWLVKKGAALDLTVDPDFSQVEADVAQLTAKQRFALDPPEKRAFFREGVDLVSTSIDTATHGRVLFRLSRKGLSAPASADTNLH